MQESMASSSTTPTAIAESQQLQGSGWGLPPTPGLEAYSADLRPQTVYYNNVQQLAVYRMGRQDYWPKLRKFNSRGEWISGAIELKQLMQF